MSTAKLTDRNPSRIDSFLKSKEEIKRFFISIGVCGSFLGRRAARNCRKSQEGMHLDGVVNESAIVVVYFIFSRVIVKQEVKLLITIEQSSGHVHVKNVMTFNGLNK